MTRAKRRHSSRFVLRRTKSAHNKGQKEEGSSEEVAGLRANDDEPSAPSVIELSPLNSPVSFETRSKLNGGFSTMK